MPRSPTGSVWLLVAIAAVLASLAGLVASGQRVPETRPPAPAEPSPPRRTRVELIAPPTVPADEATPSVAFAGKAKQAVAATPDERLRLRGVVLLPEGGPAAGARVVLAQQHVTCDPEGRFELVLPSLRSGADLLAWASGHEPALHAAFGAGLGKSGEHSVRLVLGPETLTLSGTVAGADGQPRKGWTVELDGPDVLSDFGLRDPVRTRADGAFVLDDVSAGVHVLRAWKEHRERAFRSAPASAGESGIMIVAYE
jgi:hypothetical protein